MATKLDTLKQAYVRELQSNGAEAPPAWLSRLLDDVPGLPSDAVPHNKPRHPDLQGAIADSSLHPAMEACLHLINVSPPSRVPPTLLIQMIQTTDVSVQCSTICPSVRDTQGDLYSAHFLVRKAQGGSRYLDWLHAILHKLEGDFRNAKMWYTDLGNNNAVASEDGGSGDDLHGQQGKAGVFRRFHEFWFVTVANGGSGERVSGADLHLNELQDVPRGSRLTAHGHTDLVFLCCLVSKAACSSAVSTESLQREVKKHHDSTTLSEDKIRDSQSAFGLDELHLLHDRLAEDTRSQTSVRGLTQLELLWMLAAMAKDFGWREYEMAETTEALKVESTPSSDKLDDGRKQKASNMVLDPGKGQRKF